MSLALNKPKLDNLAGDIWKSAARLRNKYFYYYQPPTPAKDLLPEFWKLKKEAEKMLEGASFELAMC